MFIQMTNCEARDFFYGNVVPEQEKLITLLTSLSDEIQQFASYEQTGKFAYSLIGFAGGVVALLAPCTGGSSIVIYSGSIAMAGSIFAKSVHSGAKERIVANKIIYANETLSQYKKTCEYFFQFLMINEEFNGISITKFIENLKNLTLEDKSKQSEVNYFVSFLELMSTAPSEVKMNIIPEKLIETISSLQRWLHTVNPLPEKYSPLLVIAKHVAIDIDRLYFLRKELIDLSSSYDQLKNFNKKRKCDQAEKLDGLVKEIKIQFITYKNIFK